MHVLVNLSWRCQLSCPYCLLPHIKINRHGPEHAWAEWAVALRDHTEPGAIIDLAGGDPLMFEGIADLCRVLGDSGRMWAITTNGISVRGTDEMIRVHPPGCVLINVSDHPGNYAAEVNIARLSRAFRVSFNRVDHPKAGHRHEQITNLIPFQTWEAGTELDGVRRWCDTGLTHWVADPTGDVFRCNPYMATGQTPTGNLFRRTVVTPDPIVCETGCSTCYTSVPGAWHETMRVLECVS